MQINPPSLSCIRDSQEATPPPRRALSRGDEDEEEEEETLKLLGTLLLCIEVALLTDGMQKELGRESRSE